MTTQCPCCRQQVDVPLPLVDLNSNMMAFGAFECRLTAQEAEFLSILIKRFPAVVPYERLISGIYGVNEPEDAMGVLKVRKWKICRILRTIGFDILTSHKVGLRLVALAAPTFSPTVIADRIRSAVA